MRFVNFMIVKLKEMNLLWQEKKRNNLNKMWKCLWN